MKIPINQDGSKLIFRTKEIGTESLPFPDVTTEKKVFTYDSDLQKINKSLTDFFRQNRSDPRVQRVRASTSTWVTDKISGLFPTSDGIVYLTCNDSDRWNFIVDVYHDLKHLGIDEPRLFVNGSMPYPYNTLVGILPDTVWSDELSSEAKVFFKTVAKVIYKKVRNTDPDAVHPIKLKPTTTSGWPYAFPDGTLTVVDDFMFGDDSSYFITKNLQKRYSAVRRHEIALKKAWMTPKVIVPFLRDKLERKFNPDRIVEEVLGNGIGVASISQRLNGPDIPQEYSIGHSPKDCSFSLKERPFFLSDSNEYVTGHMDINTLVKAAKSRSVHGYPLRGRSICNANFFLQVGLNYFWRVAFTGVEDSRAGFPNASVLFINHYNEYMRSQETLGRHVFHIQMDTTQAESNVTTNGAVFAEFYKGGLELLRERSNTVVFNGGKGYYVLPNCLASGVGSTTGDNVLAGLFNVSLLLSKLLGGALDEIGETIVTNLFEKNTAMHQISGYDVFLPLCTDDISCHIGVDQSERSSFEQQLEALTDWFAEVKKTSLEVVESTTNFGMLLGKRASVKSTATVSKLFLLERPGDPYRDAFATYAKWAASSQEVKEVINENLKKHFRSSISDLAFSEPLFSAYLKELGLTLKDIFNEYDPKFTVMYGKYVDSEEFMTKHVLDIESHKAIINLIKEYTYV